MKNRELLFRLTEADFVFKVTRGSGSGGQKKNKTSSAVQCFHEPSGSMAEAEDTRSQAQNKKLAFKRITETPKFKAWLKMKIDAAKGDIEVEEADDHGKMVKRKLRHEEV